MTNAPALVLTASQTALLAHFESENAGRRAWMAEDPGNRWTTLIPTDLKYLADLESEGVTTVDEYERQSLVDSHYDMYKDVHGISPRWMDYKSMSVEDLRSALDELSAEAAAMPEDDWDYEWEAEYNSAMDNKLHEEDEFQIVGWFDEYDPRYYGQITKELPRKW